MTGRTGSAAEEEERKEGMAQVRVPFGRRGLPLPSTVIVKYVKRTDGRTDDDCERDVGLHLHYLLLRLQFGGGGEIGGAAGEWDWHRRPDSECLNFASVT